MNISKWKDLYTKITNKNYMLNIKNVNELQNIKCDLNKRVSILNLLINEN